MKRLRVVLEKVLRFVRHDVWQIGRPGERIPGGIISKQVRVAILIFRGLMEEMLLLRASALTFATMLFIVPFLAFMFFFIQSFNLGDEVYGMMSARINERLNHVVEVIRGEEKGTGEEELAEAEKPVHVLETVELFEPGGTDPLSEEKDHAPGDKVNEELWRDLIGLLFPGAQVAGDDDAGPVQLLVRLAERGATNRRALTISGIIYVLSTVLGLMRNVEWSFNRIWGVKHSRNPFRMISDYLVITLLLPFVAALVLGITAALESETLMEGLGPFSVTLRGAQLMVICLTFAILYYMVPNTRVKVRYALLGGLVAGLLWTLVSWGYVKFQFGMARYEIFFSTFALFPLLLMWIYASWLILLFGALLAFAYQNEKTFALERYADVASFAYREAVAVRAVIEMTRRFRQGLPALTVAEAGNVWNVPTRLLNDTMECLVNAGLVARCATEPVSFQPARAPERIRVMDVVRAMRDAGEDPSHLRDDETYRTLFDALNAPEPQYLGASIADAADSLGPIPTSETSSGR